MCMLRGKIFPYLALTVVASNVHDSQSKSTPFTPHVLFPIPPFLAYGLHEGWNKARRHSKTRIPAGEILYLLLSLLCRCVNPPWPNNFFLFALPPYVVGHIASQKNPFWYLFLCTRGLLFIPLFSPPQNRVFYGSATPLHMYDMVPYSYL